MGLPLFAPRLMRAHVVPLPQLKNLTNLPSDIFSGQHNRDGVWCICVPEGLLHLCNHGTCNLRTGKKVHSLKMQLLKKPRIIQNDLEAQTLAVRGQTSFSSHKTHASFEPVLTEGEFEFESLLPFLTYAEVSGIS